MKRVLLSLCLVCTAACGSSSPAAPTPAPVVVPPPPTIPSCQANHTASASFTNNGAGTIDVVLDGGVLGNLAPHATGQTRTVAAGVAHTIVFRLTNTSVSLCAAFNPIPVECSAPTYGSCSY